MKTKEMIEIDVDVSNTGQSIYFNDRYFFAASAYSSNGTSYRYACIIKAEDDIEIILNINGAAEGTSYNFFNFTVLLDVPYLYLISGRSLISSTPALPEVSVNNAYAYVKVSSS